MTHIKSVAEAGGLVGKRVLVRVDWNVPVSEEGKARDEYRIQCSLPTIQLLQEKGAQVSVATHFEPVGESIEFLKQYLPDGVTLLGNVREHAGEEGNSIEFAQELASQVDVFVNEAFSASHREHASIVGVPRLLPSFAGLHFVKEVENLSLALRPQRPFLLIMGGAKLETKLPMIEKFLGIADEIFIGGTLAVAASRMSLRESSKVIFPKGDIAALDINEETVEDLRARVAPAKLVVWNGPVGKYEEERYQWGTKAIAKMLAACGRETKVIVGGGDTLAAIRELGLYDKFTFVSTGGGAMLDFLAEGTLPGIEALKTEQK